MKKDIHAPRAVVEGYLWRSRESVYWPDMNAEIKHWISTCESCRQHEVFRGKETLMSHDVTERTWQKVAADLSTFKGKGYLVTVDNYSTYWELDKLDNTNAVAIIRMLKAHFGRYSSPCQLVSGNGPQFVTDEFQQFVKSWNIKHRTTSHTTEKEMERSRLQERPPISCSTRP